MNLKKKNFFSATIFCLSYYDNTNYNLHKCWTCIFSWGYSPVSLFDILYLARGSLLKHLCCYLLLFLVFRLLASLLCLCKNSIKTPSYSMEKYQKLPNEFFWYWHRKLFSNLVQILVFLASHLPSVRCAFFFSGLLRLLFIDDQMKSQILPLKFSG